MAVELYYEIDLSSCFCTRTKALFLGKQILLQNLILYITFVVTFLGPQNPGPPMCDHGHHFESLVYFELLLPLGSSSDVALNTQHASVEVFMASPPLDKSTFSENDVEKLSPPPAKAPYSVFTNGEKWFIICAASIAGFFRCVIGKSCHSLFAS